MIEESVLAAASLLAFIAYFTFLIVLHIFPTGKNPLYNTISDYSVGKFSVLARSSTAINGIGILLLLAVLVQVVGMPPLTRTGLVWLAILALSRLAMVFVLTDLSGQKVTPQGIAHMILAALSFVAGVSAITTLTRNLSTFNALHGIYRVLMILAEISTPLLVIVFVTVLLPKLRRWLGLTERAFLLTINAWLLILVGWTFLYTIRVVH
ncbi:DUF998 domain-containing protein [Sulfoacidibacillus thermotolerans]|uniref:DUF998 domain-containing protein n=1 Tax=Sulfoacidibacillus thermotolerans TaxID=1765684 RepID=A0A2U3D611_SULT2|nr:DUF998 domain-containing protein [Sulfoacidibacillus thermotolerans]PWI56722.1 hypothetical protein BM613_12155 [Sulfoacidibacillus thermotolerans]